MPKIINKTLILLILLLPISCSKIAYGDCDYRIKTGECQQDQ